MIAFATVIAAALLANAPPAQHVILVAAEPVSAAEHVARGVDFFKQRDWDKALADFDAAVALDARNYTAAVRRAQIYLIKRDIDRAIAEFDRAIAIDDKNSEAFRFRGNAWQMKNENEKAMADLDHAIALNPDDWIAYNLRAHQWWRQRNKENARKDFERAVEINPKFSDAIVQIGLIHLMDGDKDRAIDDFTRAIEANPGNAFAYSKRADTWMQLGMTEDHIDRALADAEAAARLQPADSSKQMVVNSLRQTKQNWPQIQRDMQARLPAPK